MTSKAVQELIAAADSAWAFYDRNSNVCGEVPTELMEDVRDAAAEVKAEQAQPYEKPGTAASYELDAIYVQHDLLRKDRDEWRERCRTVESASAHAVEARVEQLAAARAETLATAKELDNARSTYAREKQRHVEQLAAAREQLDEWREKAAQQTQPLSDWAEREIAAIRASRPAQEKHEHSVDLLGRWEETLRELTAARETERTLREELAEHAALREELEIQRQLSYDRYEEACKWAQLHSDVSVELSELQALHAALQAELKEANYWRERWCHENTAHAEARHKEWLEHRELRAQHEALRDAVSKVVHKLDGEYSYAQESVFSSLAEDLRAALGIWVMVRYA